MKQTSLLSEFDGRYYKNDKLLCMKQTSLLPEFDGRFHKNENE